MLKRSLSLMLVVAMAVTMLIFVGTAEAAIPAENQTSVIFDEGFETNDKALAFFNQTSGSRLSTEGVNGTFCASNQQSFSSGLFHNADFTHTFKPSKRYYVTFLVKPVTEAAVSKNLIAGLLGSLKNTGSNVYPLPSLSRTAGWNGATIYNSTLASGGWNLVGARIDTGEAVSADGASMQDYLAGAAANLAANSLLVDNYIVIEEDPAGLSGTNSAAVRPVVFDTEITRANTGALKAGEVLTASAYAYEVNLVKNAPAAVYFDWYRSNDGESWELIGERQTGTLNTARNAYGTFDATGTYTVTEEDLGSFIKVEAVAMTRNNKYGTDIYSTDFGDKSESSIVGELPLEPSRGIIIESGLETADDSLALIGNKNNVAVGKGVKGTNAIVNYAKSNGQFFPKAPLLPEFEKGKTYHFSLLAQGAEADVANMVFKAYYNGASGVTDARIAVVGDAASKAFTTGHVAGEFAQRNLTTEDWTRLGFRLTVGRTGTNSDAIMLLLNNAAMKTAGQVLFDNLTIVEESSETSAVHTKPFIFDGKASKSGDAEIKAGDVLTFTAHTYDANQNVVPDVSFKLMKSSDGVVWNEFATVDAQTGSVNEFGTYTATAGYTATSAEEGCVVKAVATASSTGAESGTKTDSCETGETGSLGELEITVSIEGSGTVKVGDSDVSSGTMKVNWGDTKTFILTPAEKHSVAGASYNGEVLEIKDNAFTLESIKAGGTLVIRFAELSAECFVSPDGDDANAGTLDAPFKTLARAKEYINEMKASGAFSDGNYVINLRGGVYELSSTLNFTEADSGTEEQQIIWKAYNGEQVEITGSKALNWSAFKPVSGEMKELIRSKDARDKVLVADLTEAGIGSVGAYSATFYPAEFKGAPVLMMDGEVMSISRWPNGYDDRDWPEINCGDDYPGTYDGDAENGFIAEVNSSIPSSWTYSWSQDEVFATGIWINWYNMNMCGVSYDPETRLMTAKAFGRYINKATQKAQFWNVYEEIDKPGEWYIDKKNNKIYLYPTSDSEVHDFRMANLSGNLIDMNGADWITFDGIDFSGANGKGIYMYCSSNNTVKNAKIYGNGGVGVHTHDWQMEKYRNDPELKEVMSYYVLELMDKCVNNTVDSCEITANGANGVDLGGGHGLSDPPELTGHVLKNSVIHDNGRYAIGTTQVGLGHGSTVSGNDIYHGYYIAMTTPGSSTIENNNIHDINLNSTDMGAIYNGRDISYLDVVIRNNHLYNVGGGKLFLPQYNNYYKGGAIFTDDGASGMTVTGNIIGPGVDNSSFGMKVHGGMMNTLSDNVIINVPTIFNFCDWTQAMIGHKLDGTGGKAKVPKLWATYYELRKNTYWTTKYPEFAKDYHEINPYPNEVSGNALVYVGERQPASWYQYTVDYSTQIPEGSEIVGLNTNKAVSNASTDLFKDWANGNFEPTDELYAQTGVPKIDYEAIGSGVKGKKAPSATGAVLYKNSDLTIKVRYDYADADGEDEGNTHIEWFAANANSESFKSLEKYGTELELKGEVEGKKVRCVVTPYDEGGVAGVPVTSDIMLLTAGDVDTDALWNAISNAEILIGSATVGTDDGQYPESAVNALKEAVAAAKIAANSEALNQYQADRAEKTLVSAIDSFMASMISSEEYVNLAPFVESENGWTVVTGTTSKFENGQLTLGSGDYVMYTEEKFDEKIYTFDVKITPDSEGATFSGAFYFGVKDPSKQIWSSNEGWLLWFKNTSLECQRWSPQNLTSIENSVLSDEETHNVAVGVYNTADGMKYKAYIDGNLVFTKDFDNSISSEGYFGFYCSTGAVITVSPAKVDFTALDSAIEAAEKLAESTVGEGYGEYPASAKTALTEAISAAKAARTETAAQQSVDKAELALIAAAAEFEKSVKTSENVTADKAVNIITGTESADFEVADGVKLTMNTEEGKAQPAITVETACALGTVSLKIPEGSTLVPGTLVSKSGTVPSVNASDMNVKYVYTLGSSDGNAVMSDSVVRIVVPGAKGAKIAYKSGNSYREITKIIRTDSEAAALAELDSNAFVRYNGGEEVVVYTKTLTELIVYTKAAAEEEETVGGSISSSGSSGGASGGGTGAGSTVGGFYQGVTITPSSVNRENVFDDIVGHWAEADIISLNAAGIVSGVTDKLFEPERSITRAEFATLVAKALKLSEGDAADFKDVSEASWCYSYVKATASAGIISGYDGYFRPDDTITREEMAVILVKALEYLGKPAEESGVSFTDASGISDWAKAYVDKAASTGLISGMTDGTLAPKANATRAQAAAVIRRLLSK